MTLLLIACNLGPAPLDDKTTGDTGDTEETGTSGGGASIFDVRTGVVPVGEVVTLTGVLVSSPHTKDDEGFFVQDPSGGPNSGIYVWGYNGVADVYAEPGDEVTVTGTPTDYFGWLEFAIDSGSDVVETGTGTLPAPVDLGDGDGADWEAYESVPVTLTNQTIESVDDFFAGELSAGLKLDDGFVPLEYDCRGTYESITGIVFYEYGEWSLNARSEADAGAYTEAERVAASLYDIEYGGVCGPVSVEGVVATTDTFADDNGTMFFAQDAGGGEWSGALFFLPDAEAGVVVGDTLTASGTVTQFYGMTEVRLDELTVTGADEPVADVIAEVPTDWESWEGCLVTIADVDVTSNESYGQVATSWDGLFVDDVLHDFTAEKGDHWDTVTGTILYSYEEWKILPRSDADLVE